MSAPISIIQIGDKGYIVSPDHNQPSEDMIQSKFSQYSGEVRSWTHVKNVIDDRFTLRTILSLIVEIAQIKDTYFIVKEKITNTSVGQSMDLPNTTTEIQKWIETNSDKVIPYSKPNLFLPSSQSYYFLIVPHEHKNLHAIVDPDKMIQGDSLKSQQEQLIHLYDIKDKNDKVAPISQSKQTYVSMMNECKDKPNLVFISNSIMLSNRIPCVVYRPTLNDFQMKSKLYMPKVRSKWDQEELQQLILTTKITEDGKMMNQAKKGLFVWILSEYSVVHTTTGIVKEKLENTDYLVQIKDTQQNIVIPERYIQTPSILTESKVDVVKPIWTLLHIHPSGKMALMSTSVDHIEKTQMMVCDFMPVPIHQWKPVHNTIHYTYTLTNDSLKSSKSVQFILSGLRNMKSILYEKRSIISIGNKVDWFSREDQKWKEGTVVEYPDLQTYIIRTAKGNKTLPWTLVRPPKESNRSKIELIMDRVEQKRFAHPLASHIQDLREKGYSVRDILQNLHETFKIPYEQANTFISQSLDIHSIDEPGVILSFHPNQLNQESIQVVMKGRHTSDIEYSSTIFQSLLVIASEIAEGKESVQEETDDDLNEIEMEDDEIDGLSDIVMEDLEIDEDDLDIEDELNEIQAGFKQGEDSTELVQTAFTTSLSIFLTAMYKRDPSLFTWEAKSKRDQFARICQEAKRHPKMMTNEVKLEVDTNSPGAYGLSSFAEAAGDLENAAKLREKEVACSSADSKSQVECMAIYHGYGENKHWYICPRIYDILEQRPLRLQDLDFERDYKPRGWKSSDWRIDESGQDIELFGPTYKGRGLVKNLTQSDYNQNSLFLLPNKADYFYPGLLAKHSHPKDLYMPCCFKKPNKRLEELFGIVDEKKAGSVNYVQGWNKTLGWNPPRIGIIPPSIRTHFRVHPLKYKTGMIHSIASSSPIWLRRGLPYGPNPFVECLANSIDDGTTDVSILKRILESVNQSNFEEFNQGLLSIIFTDPNLRQSSFDSYRNHLLFGTNIGWETVLDPYSKFISPKHVWILIDCTNAEEPNLVNTSSSAIHLNRLYQLQRLQRSGSKEAKEWKVFFAIKQDLLWTPVYKIKLQKKSYDIIRGLPGDDEQAIDWVHLFLRNTSPQRHTISNTIKTYPGPNDYLSVLKSEELSPVYATISSNYMIGFLHNTIGFLPFYMQNLRKEISDSLQTPILWEQVPPSDDDSLVKFYVENGFNHPFKAVVNDSKTGKPLYVTTMYGVEVPIVEVKSNTMKSLPKLINTAKRWRQSFILQLKGMKQIANQTTISETIQELNKLELEYTKLPKLQQVKTLRFRPITFHSLDDGTIISATIRVIFKDKEHTEFQIPVKAQKVKKSYLDDLRREFGVTKATSGSTGGLIYIPSDIALDTMIEYLQEIRARSLKNIKVQPIQYLFDAKNVIGFVDESGTKYILDRKHRFKLNETVPGVKQFSLTPLYLDYYLNKEADIYDSIMQKFYIYIQKLDLKQFATTANIWRNSITKIHTLLDPVKKKLKESMPSVNETEIDSAIDDWIARISWNESLREKLRNDDIQQTVPIDEMKARDDEIIVKGTDIQLFQTMQFSDSTITRLPRIELSSDKVKIDFDFDSKDTYVSQEEIERHITGGQRVSGYITSSIHGSMADRDPSEEVILPYQFHSTRKLNIITGNPRSIIRAFVIE